MTTDAAPILFAYPPQAAFGRVLPKNKIYTHVKPSRRLQQRFAAEVAQIVWQFKLAPETIRLEARPDVPELQVLTIKLKDAGARESSEDVLRCIDRAIKFPIIFEVVAGDRVRVVAAYKRPSEADSAKWVVGDYFSSPWLPADAPRAPLPVVLDLAALYTCLLRRLMPHPARDGELLKDHAERTSQIRSLERDYGKTHTRLMREKQFNRKVETNAELRAIQAQLDELTL
ncbi:MAG TPA: DUF4391 domain-containing protein [Phycisphaerae bacterium]|nr:DUF4391 domain-containing protein [Phycisphaerae bacterium]